MATGIIPKNTDGNDSGWIRFSESTDTIPYKIMYRKIGNTVFIKSEGAITGMVDGTNQQLGYLPSGYRPPNQTWFPCYCANPVYQPNAYLRVYQASSGGCTLGLATNSGVTANTQIYVAASFLVD